MTKQPDKKKNKRPAGPTVNRRKCREYAVQVVFCEFYNSQQVTRAVAAVRATAISDELGKTRSLLKALSKESADAASAVDSTLSNLYAVAHTGELPKSAKPGSYTETEGPDILSELSFGMEEAAAALKETSAKVAELNLYFGRGSFTLELLRRFHDNQTRIKEVVSAALRDWRSDRLKYEDWAIMHLGATEILYFPEVPPKVTINEYIEIAKDFGGDDESARFVNGILDSILRAHPRPERPGRE